MGSSCPHSSNYLGACLEYTFSGTPSHSLNLSSRAGSALKSVSNEPSSSGGLGWMLKFETGCLRELLGWHFQ